MAKMDHNRFKRRKIFPNKKFYEMKPSNSFPATNKQIKYLEVLGVNFSKSLSMKKASDFIQKTLYERSIQSRSTVK